MTQEGAEGPPKEQKMEGDGIDSGAEFTTQNGMASNASHVEVKQERHAHWFDHEGCSCRWLEALDA
jgi:hypothetical protein